MDSKQHNAKNLRQTLLKLLRWCRQHPILVSARGLSALTVLGALTSAVSSVPTDSLAPLSGLLASIGVNLLASFLDRFSKNPLSDSEIEVEVARILANTTCVSGSELVDIPVQFMNLTSAEMLRLIDAATHDRDYATALLLTQTWDQTGLLRQEMQTQTQRLIELLSKLDEKNDHAQDEIIQRLDFVISLLHNRTALDRSEESLKRPTPQPLPTGKRMLLGTLTLELQHAEEDYQTIERAYLTADVGDINRYRRKLNDLLDHINALEMRIQQIREG